MKKYTFLFNGRALNLGIFAIISSSSSAELFTFTGRALCAVSNSGSLGLVKVILVFPCIEESPTSWNLKARKMV